MITVPARSQCAGPSRGWPRGGSGAGHDPLLEGTWPRPTTPARGSRHLCPDGYPCSSRHPVASAQLEQSSLRARPWRRSSAGAWSRCVPGVETRWRLPAPDRRTADPRRHPNLSLARPSGFLTVYLSALVLVNTRSRTAPPPAASPRGSAASPRSACSSCSACSPHPPGCPGQVSLTLAIAAQLMLIARPAAVLAATLPLRIPQPPGQ